LDTQKLVNMLDNHESTTTGNSKETADPKVTLDKVWKVNSQKPIKLNLII
jgi:hypothetical protein